MQTIEIINSVVAIAFTICYAYQFFYILVPFLFRQKKHKAAKQHKIAVIISARNEEGVIGHLLDTVNNQDYPSELITAFVVADNCTDKTAEVSRKKGAVVLERFNDELVGKGYALDYLFSFIKKDYGFDAFDGYLVLDADNLLRENYITEMNKTFSDGYKIITGYRNSKNYGDNWISAGYALWFLRESKYLNNSRMLLGTSCAVSGTGFMFSNEIIKKTDGWKYFLLTEDIEFSVRQIIDGEKIGFCGSAELFDEQPIKFSQSWRQRMRWAKGYYQVFRNYGTRLIKGVFKGSFACFDMSMVIMPAILITVFGLVSNLASFVIGTFSALTTHGVLVTLNSLLSTLWSGYLMLFIIGAITTVTEWKKIHTTPFKKILYAITFPIFMYTYIPIAVVAIFKKVKWTPIAHTENKALEEVTKD